MTLFQTFLAPRALRWALPKKIFVSNYSHVIKINFFVTKPSLSDPPVTC